MDTNIVDPILGEARACCAPLDPATVAASGIKGDVLLYGLSVSSLQWMKFDNGSYWSSRTNLQS